LLCTTALLTGVNKTVATSDLSCGLQDTGVADAHKGTSHLRRNLLRYTGERRKLFRAIWRDQTGSYVL
jgi:hypothetical protein